MTAYFQNVVHRGHLDISTGSRDTKSTQHDNGNIERNALRCHGRRRALAAQRAVLYLAYRGFNGNACALTSPEQRRANCNELSSHSYMCPRIAVAG